MFDLRKCIICLFLVLTLFLQVSESPGREQKPEPVKLKVLLIPFLSYAPFFIADKEGYFSEQGLQIEFVKISRTDEAIPVLAQGKLDVAAGPVSVGIMNAMARGAKIKFVADKGFVSRTGCTYNALIARRPLVESGKLDSPIQLKGKRIDVNRVFLEGYFVEKLLNTVGLTLGDVEIVDIPPAIEQEALAKGTIDLTVQSEPQVTRTLQDRQGVIWMPFQQVIPDFQFAFILYGPTLLEKNPEAGKRFMIAYLKAVRQYNQGKTERNLQIISTQTGLDQEFLKKACWLTFRDNGQINIESVLDFQSWGVRKGFIEKEVSPDQFWDPGFIEYANKVLSTPDR